jgi:hypothetical protein
MVSTPVSFCDRSTWHLLSSRHHTEYSFRFQPGPLVWQVAGLVHVLWIPFWAKVTAHTCSDFKFPTLC